MHIKRVRVHRFKSFNKSITIDGFSPKFNVICGENGSGKSNLIQCIEFLMSDEYYPLKDAQRRQIRADQATHTEDTIVEIIFDNSDGRFPLGERNVALERRIGSVKDDFLINKKRTQRQEVISLFESAGISRLNPYFIVKQGRINQMATTTPTARLNLLKDIAGVAIYDEHKIKVKELLEQSKNKMEAIEDSLGNIIEKLAPLEEEAQALTEYQQKDKEMRAIDYVLVIRQIQIEQNKLEKLRKEQEHASRRNIKDEFLESMKSLSEANENIKNLKKIYTTEGVLLNSYNSDSENLIAKKAKLESQIQDLDETIEKENTIRQKLEEEVSILDKEINEKVEIMNSIKPQLALVKGREMSIMKQLAHVERKRSEILIKLGRESQFDTKQDRDIYIREQLRQLEKIYTEKQVALDGLVKSAEADRENAKCINDQILSLETELQKHLKAFDDAKLTSNKLRQERDLLRMELNDIRRKDVKLQETMVRLGQSSARNERKLQICMGRSIYQGWKSANEILELPSNEYLRDKYHGLVVENFSAGQSFNTCIDVVGGSKLFYHIVDDAKTAQRILDIIKEKRLPGELFFVVKDKLTDRDLPQIPGSVGELLMRRMIYDSDLEPVFRYLFGRVVVVRSLDQTFDYLARKRHQMHQSGTKFLAVTLEGDTITPSGALTGGYIARGTSRLYLFRTYRGEKLEYENSRVNVEKYQTESDRNLALMDEKSREIDIFEHKMRNSKEKFESIKIEIRLLKETLTGLKKNLEVKDETILKHRAESGAIEMSIENFVDELRTDMPTSTQISRNDQELLDELNEKVIYLAEEKRKLSSSKTELELKLNSITNLLEQNLYKLRDEKNSEIQSILFECREQTLESATKRLEHVNSKLSELQSKSTQLEKTLEERRQEINSFEDHVEHLQARKNELQCAMVSESSRDLKRRLLIDGITERLSTLRGELKNFGVVPWSFSTFQNEPTSALRARLSRLKHEVSIQRSVDFKSLTNLEHLLSKKASIEKSRDERIEDLAAIESLIQLLEQTKTDVLIHTLTQVSISFNNIFRELVGSAGEAKLVLRSVSGNGQESQDINPQEGSEAFVGIDINCSFSGTNFEMKEVRTLSGGQKTLVALALVLAIQECDPSPFYILDEIDAALDSEYREAVAKLLRLRSENSQFIASTFRAEFIHYGDKFFMTKFHPSKGTSECCQVQRNEAQKFIYTDQQPVN